MSSSWSTFKLKVKCSSNCVAQALTPPFPAFFIACATHSAAAGMWVLVRVWLGGCAYVPSVRACPLGHSRVNALFYPESAHVFISI
jgi:hypothetical protein